jgi:hypothetical protein
MGFDRTNLTLGPAKLTFNGGTFFSKEPIDAINAYETIDIATDAHGKVDERRIETASVIPLTPEGAWTAAARAALWPYANTVPGALIHPVPDLPLVIHSRNNDRHTYKSGAVTRMPDIFLSATKTIIGQVEFSLVRENNKNWNDADSFLVIDSSAYSDATFAPANIKVQSYVGNWTGKTGFGAIETRDGWTINFNLRLEPQPLDSFGRLTWSFVSLDVMARCIPANVSQANIFNALGLHTNLRGSSLQNNSADLAITGADATTIITLNSAQLKTAGFRFGALVLRQGELGWVATRPFAAGVPGPLFSLA